MFATVSSDFPSIELNKLDAPTMWNDINNLKKECENLKQGQRDRNGFVHELLTTLYKVKKLLTGNLVQTKSAGVQKITSNAEPENLQSTETYADAVKKLPPNKAKRHESRRKIATPTEDRMDKVIESEFDPDVWMEVRKKPRPKPPNIGKNSECSRKSSPNLTLTLDADQISISDAAKYLGLLVDDQLSFKNHIALLENKISRSVGIMYKLSYYLPSNTLLLLYYSLIHTQLMYVLPIWASTFPTYLNTLKRLQNKALRIITKSSLRESMTPHYFKLQILKLEDLYKLEVAKFMHQFSQNKLPCRNFSHPSSPHSFHSPCF